MAEPRRAPEAGAADPRETLLRFVQGASVTQCIYVAAKLGIANFLADGPKTSEELARETSVHAPSLSRVMRTLAGLGVFRHDGEGCFSLTPVGEMLRSDVEGSVRDMAIMRGENFVRKPWGAILESVQTGESAFRHVFGKDPFEHFQEDQEAAQVFDRAMRAASAGKAAAIVNTYDFTGIRTLVDVGGGTGGLLAAILNRNPQMKGILAETPHVAGRAELVLAEGGLSDRCRCVEADMFERVPEGGDAYMMASIIHSWDDEQSIQVLSNCRRAMRASAKILLVETLLAPPTAPHFSHLMDLEMLVMTDGGRERSESEYAALYEAAGFQLTRVVTTDSPWCVIEGNAV